jgi:DNA-directed RNA polymerase specialized sigma54-like protein
MRTKLTPATSAAALGRMLDQLDRELIEASDEEVLEAARDLGMNPMMKGSAAFLGLQSFSFAEFLEGDALRNVLLERAAQNSAARELASKRKARRLKQERPIERKDSADK